jgi:hypothetical protein
MKLSLYAFVVSLTIANLANGMEHREPSPITVEELLAKHDATATEKGGKPAPVTVAQKKEDPKKANNLTSQEVSRLTLYAIAEKRLGANK